MDMISLKTDVSFQKVPLFPMSDRGIVRNPDIVAFHGSLDRTFDRDYEFAGETHPFYELVVILSGSVGITAGEEIYSLHRCEMLLHPPGEFHRIWTEGESEAEVLNLSFHAATVPELTGRTVSFSEEEGAAFRILANSVSEALDRSDLNELNRLRLELELWLLRVMKDEASNSERLMSAAALRYAEIVSLMREHIGEMLGAQEIARLCNMSLSNLKKIFNKYAGMGVSHYFTEMKMQRAAELLRSGKRVGETAEALGFPDQNYFSTAFRRVMGCPPGSFRNE